MPKPAAAPFLSSSSTTPLTSVRRIGVGIASQRSAPRRIGADYLAFYQTGAFKGQEEAQTVTYYASTRRYQLVTRRELLPAEADHPRAGDYYFRIDLGPLQRLTRPIPAVSLRRITFIPTTLDRLLSAPDVRDLFYHEDPFDSFGAPAPMSGPNENRLVDDWPVDIAAPRLSRHSLLNDPKPV